MCAEIIEKKSIVNFAVAKSKHVFYKTVVLRGEFQTTKYIF